LSLINHKFHELRKQGKFALMPFLMAGDPTLDITNKILMKLQEKGADFIELGIPYSDPLADGPIIQLSASRALKSGTSLVKVLDLLKSLKGKLHIPVILFTYFNPLLNFGFKKFCEIASDVGAAGVIIPDLPLEETKKFSQIANDFNLDLILLIAPTTPIDRMKMISKRTRGFSYLVSVTGVTGERNDLENRVEHLIRQLKEISSNPIAVGFGISSPEHIIKVRQWGADGVIIGSAFVKRISDSYDSQIVNEVSKFCSEMRLAADKILY
tara:strand:- start:344 stop:1150 length:807 start_codon:yes stop_codon:yes gene_type:complete